jgi:hypothetical protein
MRATKIVATLGPATSSPEVLERLLRAGVDVVRLNFSHGSAQDHIDRARLVRELAAKVGKPVALMADLQGPKIRVGKFAEGRVMLVAGRRFVLDAQRSEPGKPVGVLLNHGRHGIVVHPAEMHRLFDRNEMQVSQRIGRDHLKVDAPLCHSAQANIDIHERTAHILHPIEPVALSNLKKGRTVRVAPHEGPVITSGANRLLKHDVRMQIHNFGLRQSRLLHVFSAFNRK